MSNVDNTVQWTLDRDGDLSILAQGKWYGFIGFSHPSEVAEEGYIEGFSDTFLPFLGGDTIFYLDNQDLKTFTFEGDK